MRLSIRFSILATALLTACSESTSVPLQTYTPVNLPVLGRGDVLERATTDLSARGSYVYTGTATRSIGGVSTPGNATKIWRIDGAAPALIDSIIVPNAVKISDIQVSDDGRLLIASTEFSPGSILVYDLSNPAKPALLSRFTNANTNPGVHTAEVQRVNGVLHAFLSTDAQGVNVSRLVIVRLSDPANPQEVSVRNMGQPFIHDVFVRGGYLFTMLWNEGVEIFDIGGGGRGGSVTNPVSISRTTTVGGRVHNGWWYHDNSGSKRYLFIGEEGPAVSGNSSSGDIHVLDISDMANPVEVAYYSLPGAGAHNFSVDEARGILYAAYYNGGVRVLDIRGNLGDCVAEEKGTDDRCDLTKMKREIGSGLMDAGRVVFVWGAQLLNRKLYVSDMLSGLWVLDEYPR